MDECAREFWISTSLFLLIILKFFINISPLVLSLPLSLGKQNFRIRRLFRYQSSDTTARRSQKNILDDTSELPGQNDEIILRVFLIINNWPARSTMLNVCAASFGDYESLLFNQMIYFCSHYVSHRWCSKKASCNLWQPTSLSSIHPPSNLIRRDIAEGENSCFPLPNLRNVFWEIENSTKNVG